MKKTNILLGLFAFVSLSAQYQKKILNVVSNDLVYNAGTNKIFASIPASNGPNGNSLGIINPVSGLLESTTFIGSDPTIMAITENGKYIYTGFSGTNKIKRYVISSNATDQEFDAGTDSYYGNYYPEDMAVKPGTDNVLVVSRYRKNVSPRHGGVIVIDNGIIKPSVTQDHTGSNKIEFSTNPDWLYGWCTESTEAGLRRLQMDNTGVKQVGVFQNVLPSFTQDFIHHNNKLYSTNGYGVNVVNAPYVEAQFFNDRQGIPFFDVFNNKIVYAVYNSWTTGNVALRFYNPDTFLLENTVDITESQGSVKSLKGCGKDCFVLNTSDNKIVIVSKPNLATEEIATKDVSVFPNPAKDFVRIESKENFKDFKLYDQSGRLVKTGSVNSNKVDLKQIKSGSYILELTNSNNQSLTKKIIKE